MATQIVISLMNTTIIHKTHVVNVEQMVKRTATENFGYPTDLNEAKAGIRGHR